MPYKKSGVGLRITSHPEGPADRSVCECDMIWKKKPPKTAPEAGVRTAPAMEGEPRDLSLGPGPPPLGRREHTLRADHVPREAGPGPAVQPGVWGGEAVTVFW